MSRTAYLVCGPEGSGTRYLTSLLIAAGCQGTDAHDQPLELPGGLDVAGDSIVIRYSFPFGIRWPDLGREILPELLERGYAVRIVGLVRSFYCTSQSQLDRDLVGSIDQAARNVAEAIERIAGFADSYRLPILWLTYEELIHCPAAARHSLAAVYGLELPAHLPPAEDGNAKYLGALGAGSNGR